jgi:hypothetical protein
MIKRDCLLEALDHSVLVGSQASASCPGGAFFHPLSLKYLTGLLILERYEISSVMNQDAFLIHFGDEQG